MQTKYLMVNLMVIAMHLLLYICYTNEGISNNESQLTMTWIMHLRIAKNRVKHGYLNNYSHFQIIFSLNFSWILWTLHNWFASDNDSHSFISYMYGPFGAHQWQTPHIQTDTPITSLQRFKSWTVESFPNRNHGFWSYQSFNSLLQLWDFPVCNLRAS